MAGKRPAAALDDGVRIRPRRDTVKRTKMSPSADERSNSSSIASSCSVSEDSALQSSPTASLRDRLSSMSSLESVGSESDSESSVSRTSDSDASESEDEALVAIGAPKKPDMSRASVVQGQEALKARLAAFLPQLEKANSLLGNNGKQYSMEHVEDGEQHIEMNLGLGVLEEQGEGGDSGSDSSSEASEGEDEADDGTEQPVTSGVPNRSPNSKETNYMDALTGRQAAQSRVGIEEIG